MGRFIATNNMRYSVYYTDSVSSYHIKDFNIRENAIKCKDELNAILNKYK